MTHDVSKRGFDPEDYRVAAQMGGLKKKLIPIMKKPRLKKLLDEYAIISGQHWCCEQAMICARGKTPEEAYTKLMEHFDYLSQCNRFNLYPSQVRA